MRLEFRDARGELVRKVRVVVEQLGARMDDGLGAQGGDVVRIGLEDRAQRFHREAQRNAALAGSWMR